HLPLERLPEESEVGLGEPGVPGKVRVVRLVQVAREVQPLEVLADVGWLVDPRFAAVVQEAVLDDVPTALVPTTGDAPILTAEHDDPAAGVGDLSFPVAPAGGLDDPFERSQLP